MKNRAIAAAICSFVFIAAFLTTIIFLKNTLSANSAMAVEAVPDTSEVHMVSDTDIPAQEEDKYILKEYGGNICVFYGQFQDIPAIITDISVHSLPTNDRELLFHGIEVSGRQEVLKLLEDFGS